MASKGQTKKINIFLVSQVELVKLMIKYGAEDHEPSINLSEE